MTQHADTAGLIIAGGRGTRLGSVDKCLLKLGEQSLLEHIYQRLAPQVSCLALNANGDPSRFAAALAHCPVSATMSVPMQIVADGTADCGPLGGVVAGLQWLHTTQYQWLVTVAADTPFFPVDLVQQLHRRNAGARPLVMARETGQLHPLFGLWHQSLLAPLQDLLASGKYKMQNLIGEIDGLAVDISPPTPTSSSFFNINTQEDLNRAQHYQVEFLFSR